MTHLDCPCTAMMKSYCCTDHGSGGYVNGGQGSSALFNKQHTYRVE